MHLTQHAATDDLTADLPAVGTSSRRAPVVRPD